MNNTEECSRNDENIRRCPESTAMKVTVIMMMTIHSDTY